MRVAHGKALRKRMRAKEQWHLNSMVIPAGRMEAQEDLQP